MSLAASALRSFGRHVGSVVVPGLVAKPMAMLMSTAATAAAPKAVDLLLHGFPTSSTAIQTRFVLNLKGFPFKEHTLPIHTRPDGRPESTVRPFLEANGEAIRGCGAIFNFVNEMENGQHSLLPEDIIPRTQTRRLATLCSTEVAPYGFYRVDEFLAKELKVPKPKRDQWHRHFLTTGFATLEDALNTAGEGAEAGLFLVGDAPTMADVFVQPQVYWSQNNPDEEQRVDLAQFPILQRCYENTLNLDAFQNALPDKRLR